MINDLENYYWQKPEPTRGCLLALREYILKRHPALKDAWKYRMPHFVYHDKMCCYLWTDKKTGHPYIGFAKGKHLEHPGLIKDDRKYVKIFPVDPEKDLPIDDLDNLFGQLLPLFAHLDSTN